MAMSLQEGIVPGEWKEANMIPLFKKGSRNNYVNHRPDSLTSVICKLLETIIRDHYDGLSHQTQITKPFSASVPKSKIMPHKLFFFPEITKWVDDGSPVLLGFSESIV